MEGSEVGRGLIVAIAINGSRKSKSILKWAIEKFIPESNFMVKLLHVRPKITGVPTPMGNLIPVSKVRDDVVAAYRKDVEWQTSEKLQSYINICVRNKVKVELMQIESDDIVDAISLEIKESNIVKLVVGASSRPIFSRKGQDLSSRISESIPGFCTVYVISKGKLSSLRPSESDCDTIASIRDDSSEISYSTSTDDCSTIQNDNQLFNSSFRSPPLPMQRFQALSSINQTFLHSRANSVDVIVKEREDSSSLYEEDKLDYDYGHPNSETSSFMSMTTERKSWISDRASTSSCQSPTECSSDSQDNLNFEMERLRIELKHVKGIYALTQNEAIGASRKATSLVKRLSEEETKLKEIGIKEKEAKEQVMKEKERRKSAKREAEYINDCAMRESFLRKDAEMKASIEANERAKLEHALVGPLQQYHKFTWEELSSATSSFSEDLKIGIGANGTVYKCVLLHTTAAVKVLHSKEAHANKQFQQELEVLSKTRHPHLLSLLGACPEKGCLVYEYMSNGSLEDVLIKNNNKKAGLLPWFTRFQIAWEIASALAFLHNAKPRSIIHRDLKPANILLDHNFVSKIGDVGLSKMLHSDPITVCRVETVGPVGTLCYIDPEYQRSGQVSTMSDVYAFGIVILQLLTAKPAMALAHAMETGLEDDRLSELLDPTAGIWPIEETKELAILGLKCCEIRRRDRPDLSEKVLPTLDRLKNMAARAREVSLSLVSYQPPPNHFVCPILKEIMEEPCVAGDGYTYDRRAIELWLDENDTSPMTNLPLLTKILLPNYTLLSAIMEWKSGKKLNDL